MRITDLEYFIELERCGSISKAAREGFISQQGLSRVIDAMEKELGIQLFIRSRNGIRLTEKGKAFAEHAKHAVKSYHRGLHAIEERKGNVAHGNLNVAISSYIPIVLFDRAMDRIRFEERVSYREMRLRQIEAELKEGAKDVLYLADWIDGAMIDAEETRSSYEVVKMFSSPFGIVTAEAEPMRTVMLSDVAKRPLASFGGEDYCKTVASILGSDALDLSLIHI